MRVTPCENNNTASGGILLYVLLGIVLLGTLTIAIRNTSSGGSESIDTEDMVLKGAQVQRYADELAAAVTTLINNGISEADIRFAHDDAAIDYGDIDVDPEHQVFGKQGAKATYKAPPPGVNDGSAWEFFGTTRIPQIGSERAELIAVLPNVTEAFCRTIDRQLGFDLTTSLPTDGSNGSTPDCVMGGSSDRFDGSFNDTSPNLLDESTFSRLPVLQGCVHCASGDTYNYFYVLLSR